MSDALDALMVIAARVLTVLLGVFATGRDAAHATAWAFAVTGDVISAGEPGGRMSVEKITDDGGLASATRRRGHRIEMPSAAVGRSSMRCEDRRIRWGQLTP